MSRTIANGQKSSVTDRVWKWQDTADESQIIPDSWADNGARETAGEGATQFYAVEVRTGLQLEYRTNRRGQATGVANRERPAIQVLYVTADGGRAVVVESQAQQSGDSVTPLADWASVIARPADAGTTVGDERRDAYRAFIRDTYPVVEG